MVVVLLMVKIDEPLVSKPVWYPVRYRKQLVPFVDAIPFLFYIHTRTGYTDANRLTIAALWCAAANIVRIIYGLSSFLDTTIYCSYPTSRHCI